MICQHCRNNIADGINSCPYCGAPITPSQPNNNYNGYTPNSAYPPVQPQQQYNNFNNYNNQPENPEGVSALVFGIIAFALSWVIPIFSIIFGAVGVKKSNKAIRYGDQGYNKRGMGVAGKILSIIAIVFNCIYTAILAISIAIVVIAATNGVLDDNSNHSHYNYQIPSYSYHYNTTF